MSHEALFQTLPAEGEQWNKPDSTDKPVTVQRVYTHKMYGVTWIGAQRKGGDMLGYAGPLDSWLAQGWVRVK